MQFDKKYFHMMLVSLLFKFMLSKKIRLFLHNVDSKARSIPEILSLSCIPNKRQFDPGSGTVTPNFKEFRQIN